MIFGLIDEQAKKHEDVDITVVREHGGHPGLKLPAAVFTNPHKSGYIWWGLHTIYENLTLQAKKTRGRWVGSRKKGGCIRRRSLILVNFT